MTATQQATDTPREPAGPVLPPEGPKESRADRRAYWTIRSAEWMGMHLPRPAGLAVAQAYQMAALRKSDAQRRTVAGNLARVLGHPTGSPLVEAATRECFLLYGRYWYETFALRSMPVDEVNRRFTVDGIEHIANGVAAGQGFIAALPHMGNWDAAGHWLAVNGYRMTAVAEALKPKSVEDLFYRHRRALGMGIVTYDPESGGGEVGLELSRRLAGNEVITLVSDRDLGGRGVDVEMFGAPRKLPAGPALLALSTGVPLSAATVFTTQEGWHCRIDSPLETAPSGNMRADVTRVTRELARSFERFISAAPADWHMFQPAWEDGAGS